MNSLKYAQAKYTITNACNATGLPPEDLVGVLSAILAEAREQMCFGLASDLVGAQGEVEALKQEIQRMKEEDANGDSE